MKISECAPADIFAHLKPYHYLLLTGPHRAGTTIAAMMMANDLGIDYYEEEDTLHWARSPRPDGIDLRDFFQAKDNVAMVLRCPAFCHTVHTYSDVPDLAVVMLVRPLEEIKASQERVRWGYARPQMEYYPGYAPPVAGAKYEYWFDVQEEALGDRAFTLEYHSLSRHPMWVPREKRADFVVRQFKEGASRGRGPRYQLKDHEYQKVKEY